jgi:exopolysaccharide biosynthesis polyprenyl glycosylphosphotransferase
VTEAPLTLSVRHTRRWVLSIQERRLILVGLDGIAVCLAFVLAFNLRTSEVRHAGFYVPRLGTVIALGAWTISATVVDTWNVRAATSLRLTVSRISMALGFSLIGLLLVFLAVPYQITRPTLILWAPLAWMLVMGERLVYGWVVAGSIAPSPVVLIIDQAAARRIWPEVRAHLGSLYQVVALINATGEEITKQLFEIVQDGSVDQVVLGLRDDIDRELFRAILACHDAGIRVRSLADLYEELTGRLLLDQLGHSWLLGLPMRSETSHIYAAVRRVIDVSVSALGLTVLGILIVPLSVLIKLDGGPIMHRQVRIGKHGERFALTKLRTMRHQPDRQTSWTEASDHRVTPVGQGLRRLHLDELPQCWSVLLGRMSLIGPRPEQPQYVERLRTEIDFYNTRLTVRPGLTGWAQVNWGYGSSVEDARIKLSYDLYYIKHESLSLDFIILARTLMAVLSLGGR